MSRIRASLSGLVIHHTWDNPFWRVEWSYSSAISVSVSHSKKNTKTKKKKQSQNQFIFINHTEKKSGIEWHSEILSEKLVKSVIKVIDNELQRNFLQSVMLKRKIKFNHWNISIWCHIHEIFYQLLWNYQRFQCHHHHLTIASLSDLLLEQKIFSLYITLDGSGQWNVWRYTSQVINKHPEQLSTYSGNIRAISYSLNSFTGNKTFNSSQKLMLSRVFQKYPRDTGDISHHYWNGHGKKSSNPELGFLHFISC